jgi:hypothetical protein
MKNEERAQLEAHFQNEIESIKGEVVRLTDLLEQVLSSNSRTTFCAYRPYPVKSSSHHREFNSRWTPWQ